MPPLPRLFPTPLICVCAITLLEVPGVVKKKGFSCTLQIFKVVKRGLQGVLSLKFADFRGDEKLQIEKKPQIAMTPDHDFQCSIIFF